MSWSKFVENEQHKSYYGELVDQIYMRGYLEDKEIFPSYDHVFRALALTPQTPPKLVILGQEPYANSCANGLAFSSDYEIPPSLRNIFTELKRSFPERGYEFGSGDLTGWARQGILLLNTSLTVEKDRSHRELWRPFVKEMLKNLSGSTFLLLGKQAQRLFREAGSEGDVVEAPHPSPQTKGFIGSGAFEKVEALIGEVDWGDHTRVMFQEPELYVEPFVVRKVKNDIKKSDIQRRIDEELGQINPAERDLFIYT